MADKVVELVHLKYFKGSISYRGIPHPVPRAAFRDKVLIYNDGKLPENWTIEDLFTNHTSKPYNP